jgi:hypothetical protein
MAVSAEDLAQAFVSAGEYRSPTTPSSPDIPASPVPLANRNSEGLRKDVVVGIGFLLALAAFVLSVRNSRALRSLKNQTDLPGASKAPAEKN